MKALITGITGQDGSILAKQLLDRNYDIVGQSRKINQINNCNLITLGITNEINYEIGDLLDINWLEILFNKHNFDEVYHFAAQSSVAQSYLSPYETLINNSLPALNLLEIIRKNSPNCKFLNACSSEIFGNNANGPLNELSYINPITSYGLSKFISYSYVKMYREDFKIFACNAILFNHESIYRKGDFFIRKLIRNAVAIKNRKLDYINFGDLNVKRDFGYAPDYMKAAYLMLQNKISKDYIIASGVSVKLSEIVEYVFSKLSIPINKIKVNNNLFRDNEVYDSYGDSSAIKKDLGWNYSKNIYEILDLLIEQELKNNN
jgi:GDPmannose 4,6-dehydratase